MEPRSVERGMGEADIEGLAVARGFNGAAFG